MALSVPDSLESAQARAGVHLSRVLTGALVSQVIPVSVNDKQGSSVLSPSGWRTEKAKETSPQYIGLWLCPDLASVLLSRLRCGPPSREPLKTMR